MIELLGSQVLPPSGSSLLLDPLRVSSLYQSLPSPGTTMVSQDGDPLAVVRDFSGVGNTFEAPTGLSLASYTTSSRQRISMNGTSSVLVGPQINATTWTMGLAWRLRSALGSGQAVSLMVVRIAASFWCEVLLTNIGGYQSLSFSSGIQNGSSTTSVGFSSADLFTTNQQYAVISYNGGTVTSTASYTLAYKGVEQIPSTIVASGDVASSGANQRTSIGGRYNSGITVTGQVDFGRVGFYAVQLPEVRRERFGSWIYRSISP